MSKAKTLASQSVFFFAGNVFTLFVGLTLQIYLARNLGAEGVGVFGLLESGVGVMAALLNFGIANTAVRYIPEHLKKKEYAQAHTLVRKGLKVLTVSGLTGVIIVLSAIPLIKTEWPELQNYQSEIANASLLIPLGLLFFFSSQILRGFLDIRYIILGSSFLQLSVKAILSLLLIYLGWGVLGYIWAVVAATIVALVWMLIGIRRHLRGIPEVIDGCREIQPQWKAYARVMYCNSLLSFWAAPLDRFLLGFFFGTGTIGVLMVAKTLYTLPAVFLQMFLSIAAPMLASAHAEGNQEEVQHIYHLCTDWLVRISLPLVIFLMVFAGPVLNQFGESFAKEGAQLLQILLVAQLVSLLCGPIGNVLNMCGLEKQMFRISIIGVIVSSIIMVAAIPVLGLPGVGLGVSFGVIYPNLMALYVARKEISFKWWSRNYRNWVLPLAVTSGSALFMQEFVFSAVELCVALVAIYVLFHGMQMLFHGLSKDDQEIFMAVRRKLNLSAR